MARLFTPSESKYYLMALDAGTGSIRAVIFDLEGNQIAVGQAEWRHLAVPDVPGSMEFDLNKNWQLACECMRQALHNAGIAPEYIAAVSACSMREGIVLYNNEGTPIWACANVDARAAREVSELKELHNNTFENEVYRATGQTLALSAIPRLLWLAHHRSDIYRQASTITMISDWLAYMLSGELAVDPSNAGTTGLLDLTTRNWKPALLDMAGLRADILSPVKETGTLLGVVSSQAAELCGLKAGTPVVVGGGDVQLGCVLFKEGALTVNKGGISQGELTGGGNLNVTGGTLAIEGLNARYNALTSISPNAEVSLDNTQGLGRGNIANDGLLTLKNVTGELRNSISGKGIVSATARTDVELDGDNSRFVGQFNIDTGSALSVNEQKNLGDASVINNGLLTISTERSWAMTHSISGSGDVTKLGTGILTLNNDSAAYQGTTDIVGGEIAFGSDSAINMASQHINIHNSGVMSGNVTTAGDVNVMPGGTLRVAKTTIGGNLENGGTVQMNSEGGKPGNVLTVNGNYTGNNGLMTFNATLGGDNSPTDKMNVKGDTQGNTRVRVDNIGGVGAQTVNGIELIEVGGNSAGNFALTTGTVEAGAYVYTLAKGKGNDEKNWYLTSKWDGVTPPDTPDPINNPPVVDPEGPSVYRPEAGSYISNIAAANSLFSHRLHDRLGEPQYIDSLHSQGSASSMWMRHVGGHERSRAGDGQLNTQANRYVLQLGGDLAQWSSNAQDRWHLGVMAGYANQHSNTQSNRVGYKSDGRISGYSAGLYATWYQNDANKTGAYVDSWALYNWFDNSVSSDNRSADDYDSRGVTASVEGGYTFEAGTFSGSEGTLNTWYVQPQAQITWMGVKDSDHTRKDGTRIETEGDGNVQTRLGVKTYLNSHHQRDDGKQREFQPYIEANWINNSKVYAVKMNGQTVGREGARNLGEVRTGVEAKVNNNLSLWGNVGVQLGDKGYSDTQGMLGVKYSW
ncbi:autotransporter outer membrane beta-barrel domain-containing protein [Escherichia coli]|nr:autotransporter outer membrane beta-barrel domain-containing protein [Escherichia coli]MCV8836424.1 autotransporter outer membrane beta-barrel domain-containing protein [Escherichia coli]